ncbi:hypothetical protein A2335_01000 [Candidatus Peregrinibacteria bacterium RIFOXYB2_FULL_32_7]|nr:MAG: hypothetical protein A2335_01000 [Candidatus Peregrinibacteria bacterium RIFOXYB2_FULL_32_7]
MEKVIDVNVFLTLLTQKKRGIIYTEHSIQRARMRQLIGDNTDKIEKFEKDLYENVPHLVVEQPSESPGDRKFKIYYRSPERGFDTYVLSIDGQIRLITIYKTSKTLQKNIYKYRKRV